MDPVMSAEEVFEEQVAVLRAMEEAGAVFPDDPPVWRMKLSLRLAQIRHTLFGCIKVEHHAWDSGAKRILHIGRICLVCYREYS
jgi:hypothetical protein